MLRQKKNQNTEIESKLLDPLYVIFEQHLLNFQDSNTDRRTFIGNIIKEYFTHLRKGNVSVPPQYEHLIAEELSVQVNHMLIKKIYGCLNVEEYRKNAPIKLKKRAKSRYNRMRA